MGLASFCCGDTPCLEASFGSGTDSDVSAGPGGEASLRFGAADETAAVLWDRGDPRYLGRGIRNVPASPEKRTSQSPHTNFPTNISVVYTIPFHTVSAANIRETGIEKPIDAKKNGLRILRNGWAKTCSKTSAPVDLVFCWPWMAL